MRQEDDLSKRRERKGFGQEEIEKNILEAAGTKLGHTAETKASQEEHS
jgi:hypothetical protein